MAERRSSSLCTPGPSPGPRGQRKLSRGGDVDLWAAQRASPARPSSSGAGRRRGSAGLPRKEELLGVRDSFTTSAEAAPQREQRRAGSVPAPKISRQRFDQERVAPAFGQGARGSHFAQAYQRGSLPCRIDHGSSRNYIHWDLPVDQLRQRREELLSLCAEGLRETQHPYALIARLAFADLAAMTACDQLHEETLRRVVASMRTALMSEPTAPQKQQKPVPQQGSGGGGPARSALVALRVLAAAEGPRLAPHLHMVLPPIGKFFHSRAYRELAQEAILDMEQLCGPEAMQAMRSRGLHPGPS